MGIGALSRRAGVGVETIRYYERIGLLPEPPRSPGGNRIYDREAEKRLAFIRRCRELGFSIAEIRALLHMVDADDIDCAAVQALTEAHLKTVRGKIESLRRLERTLDRMAATCAAGDVPACPIIDALFEDTPG